LDFLPAWLFFADGFFLLMGVRVELDGDLETLRFGFLFLHRLQHWIIVRAARSISTERRQSVVGVEERVLSI